VIYVGFKHISRIVKVRYPDKKLLAVYGEEFKPGIPQIGNGLFCGQHSISITHDHQLLIFNNNTTEAGKAPTVLKAEECGKGKELRKVWERTCAVDTLRKLSYVQGGNALELSDGNILVCVGSSSGKAYITDTSGKILWDGQPEEYDSVRHSWQSYPQYRVGVIENHKELERLIWNSIPRLPDKALPSGGMGQ
jgi:hypothetical protein